MKKSFIALLCIVAILSFFGCSSSGLTKYETDKINEQIKDTTAAVQADLATEKERNAPLVGEWKYTDEYAETLKSIGQYVPDTPLDFSDSGFVTVDMSVSAEEDNIQIPQYQFSPETNTVYISDYMDTNVGEMELILNTDGETPTLSYMGEIMFIKK